MRTGCLPNLRKIYFWRRKCKKVEKTAAKAKQILVKDEDDLQDTKEIIWIRDDVDSKSQIHDSSTSGQNESLHEKEVIHSKPGDELIYELNVHDSSTANKNGTQATQESFQDQWIQEYEGVPQFQSFSFDGLNAERRGTVSDEFNKVKTFDLRGVQSSTSTAAREEEKQLFGPDFLPVK